MIKLKLLIPAIICGILLALPWMGFSGVILLIAFLPLFYVENQLSNNNPKGSSFIFFIYSFIAFVLWNSLSVWWICNASIVGALLAIVVNATLMAVVFWLYHIVKQRKGDVFGFTFLIVLWISFEFLHLKWDLS